MLIKKLFCKKISFLVFLMYFETILDLIFTENVSF